MLIQWFHRSFQEHMSTTLQVSRQCQGSVYSCQSSNGSGGSCSLSEEWDTFWALRMRNCDQLMKPQFIWVPKTLQNASTKNTSIWPSTCNISNISFWDPNKTRFTHRWATWSNDIWLGISNASAHRPIHFVRRTCQVEVFNSYCAGHYMTLPGLLQFCTMQFQIFDLLAWGSSMVEPKKHILFVLFNSNFCIHKCSYKVNTTQS